MHLAFLWSKRHVQESNFTESEAETHLVILGAYLKQQEARKAFRAYVNPFSGDVRWVFGDESGDNSDCIFSLVAKIENSSKSIKSSPLILVGKIPFLNER